jgi:nucleotide-binding universal stress UspA family protein
LQVRDPILADGEPFARIIEIAETLDVNVILVGSGEKTSDDQFPMGITAERLERRSDRPVLVIKRGAPASVKRILCPVDFSDTSGRALREAVHLARQLGSQLSVLTVVQPLGAILPRISVSQEDQQKYHDKNKARFDEFLGKFDLHGVECETLIREGRPHEEILKVASEKQVDLLVMGSVGRTGLARLALGSVAQKVTRQLPCSIMTVKSEEFIRLRMRDEIDDIRIHVQRAQEMLEKGFPAEALAEFRHCTCRDPIYAPAWEGAAAAHERLGNDKEAEDCRQRAKEIVHSLWDQRIEADIRSHHAIWRKGLK